MTFSQAKTMLKGKIYQKKEKTFYCQCQFQAKSIDHKSCDVFSKKYKKRRGRLEWEHIVPAHAFGQSFISWREHKKICGKKSKSPRKCARKKDQEFSEMEGNPYNLVPSVGSINALRSNYSFAQFIGGEELCNGFFLKERKVMPAKQIRGDISRIYFYMNKTYPGRGIISRKNQKLFEAWDKLDPVDKEECDRYASIKLNSGLENDILLERCKK
ncbi:MAG: endonuclease I [Halobacteriovoraceae bacterium]|nr:endonuclease I [Halobacteriovoraceae bacterium]|tara:strand:- start:3018 stop:3659 length:642 start_codon:yes stop_codon:yes gene_type:complete